jgi:hypothetical protein
MMTCATTPASVCGDHSSPIVMAVSDTARLSV